MGASTINILYLIASILFVYGLKGLTSPRTAPRGNMISAAGMLLAVLVTMFKIDAGFGWVIAGLVVGGGIGLFMAIKVEMTDMPQLVALFNGFGGLASVLVAGSSLIFEGTNYLPHAPTALPQAATMAEQLQLIIAQVKNAVTPAESNTYFVALAGSALIGGVTLTGSLVAFAKLQGLKFIDQIKIPGSKMLNLILFIAALGLSALFINVESDPSEFLFVLITLIAFALGLTLVIPIGGADMPVVISLLNSYSGLAACAAGFVLGNNVLIISGSLVGASGLILTKIMCDAMNRSLPNVMFGTMAAGGATVDPNDVYEGKVKSTSAEEAAMILEGAQSVMVVPGYGLAVAQAQHVTRDLANLLKANDCQVTYGIHPVAGRMPGHMNVLLAEADVPYDELLDMDQANNVLPETDVVIVCGANDVVNPDARENPGSPIAGMPILDVDKAKTVFVIKRSLSPGYAGIPNPLFAKDNSLMIFGDAKAVLTEMVEAYKEL